MTDQQPTGPEDFEEKVRARARQLAETIEIYRQYDWGDELLVIDPDDVLVDRPETPAHEDHEAHPSLMRIDFDRFVDEAYVGRILDRAETVLEGEMALDRRQAIRDCMAIVEDMTIPPHVVGFHVAALSSAARRAKDARAAREEAEEEAPTPERVREAAGQGGARAIRVALEALIAAPESEAAGAAIEALRDLGPDAGWSILGRLHFEGVPAAARRPLLDLALDTEEPLAVTLVIHEVVRALEGQLEDAGPEHAVALAKRLSERDDRRAVPLMAFVLKSDAIAKEGREKLTATLQESGLWGEVSKVLGSFKGHWPLVAPSGVEFEQFAGRIAEMEGVDPKNQQAVEAFLEKARAHWQETYREDLGYYRTKDADRAGPVEESLMAQFSAEASHLVQGVPEADRMQKRIENFREEWMRSPLRSIGGRRPLAAILEERIDVRKSEIARGRARRRILATTFREARAHHEGKRPRKARAALAVLDELEPDYLPARTLRRELETGS